MDYKVALVVLVGAVALSSAAPGSTLFYKGDFFAPSRGNTFSAPSAGASGGAPARGTRAGGRSAGNTGNTGRGGVGASSSSSGFNNDLFNQAALYQLYNEDFEFEPEDLYHPALGLGQGFGQGFGQNFGLLRGDRDFFDFDPEDAYFPYF